jgi:hypothetical protein
LIQTIPKWLQGFIDFLNEKSLTGYPCVLVYLPEHITVDGGDGGCGFAAYAVHAQAIYCGGARIPDLTQSENERARMECVGHEYAHHLQRVEGREFSEEEAEEQALRWVEEYEREGKR